MSNQIHHLIVFYGGRSTEHEVSCRSAQYIFNHLDQNQYELHVVGVDKQGFWRIQDSELIIKHKQDSSAKIDLSSEAIATDINVLCKNLNIDRSKDLVTCFNIIHGGQGEDGQLQGIFTYHNVAYVGPNLLSSSASMDKITTKKLVGSVGVKVVPYTHFNILSWQFDFKSCIAQVEEKLDYPVFVKPSCSGSAIGVKQANNQEELKQACTSAFNYDLNVLVEKSMQGRELEFSFLGDAENNIVVGPAEIIVQDSFYTYEEKYSGKSQSTVDLDVSDLSQAWRKEAYIVARSIARVLHIEGISRIDFFLVDGELFLNEVNTIPGFTSISVYPKLLEKSGLSGADIINRIVDLAQNRHKQINKLKIDIS